jgi:hypothetical protein
MAYGESTSPELEAIARVVVDCISKCTPRWGRDCSNLRICFSIPSPLRPFAFNLHFKVGKEE